MAMKLSGELHSEQMEKIEQKPPVLDPSTYDGDVVIGERVANADYLADLAMMEEPVMIRLEPSSDKNASMAFPVWVNGKPAETLVNGKWLEMGWLPVAQVITVKRKVLEVIIRAKIDTVHTRIQEADSERPNNTIDRYTSPTTSFSIIEDRNPKGAAWATAVRRRNYCLALLVLLSAAVPALAATVTVPGPVVIVPLDVASVTTGGVAVTALNPGNRAAGGWLLNPTGSAQPLCINESGAVASGTVSAGSLICIAAGTSFNLAPSGLPVSVVSSDSAHGFAGEGYKE